MINIMIAKTNKNYYSRSQILKMNGINPHFMDEEEQEVHLNALIEQSEAEHGYTSKVLGCPEGEDVNRCFMNLAKAKTKKTNLKRL